MQCNLSRKRRWIMCILGILLLIFVVGLQAPVLRSSISIFLSTMSLIVLGRRLNPFRSLGYSAVLLLIFNPFFIISYSFWLSFIATFGLIMATSLSRQITTIPEIDFLTSYKDIALTTIGTFCYTLPLIVNLSGGISPIAIVSNLIVLPVINVTTILNILGFAPAGGELFLIVATFAQNILISLLNELVKYAFVVPMESFGLIEIAIYWIVLTVLIALIAHYRYFRTDKYHDLKSI
jgi:competence protein ComEC